MCRVGLYTELCYAIIPTPTLFLCFLLICYPYMLLHVLFFFILVEKDSCRGAAYLFVFDHPLFLVSVLFAVLLSLHLVTS